MKVSSIKFAVASMLAVSGLAATTAASALTLNTTSMDANSVLTFTPAAFGSSTGAGIAFRPFGNMTLIGMVTVLDPESETEVEVPSFNQPVTKADVSIGWDLKITPTSGLTSRSGLQLVRTVGTKVSSAAVANFNVDFKNKVMKADFFTAAGSVNQGLYNFVDNGDLKISLKGFVLNMSSSFSKMILTTEAQDTLATALNLSGPLRATLASTDWGTVSIKVLSSKRPTKISNVALTAADVPAP